MLPPGARFPRAVRVCAPAGVSPLDTLFPQESRTPAPHLTTSSFVYQTQLSLCHQVRHPGASMAKPFRNRAFGYPLYITHSDSLNKNIPLVFSLIQKPVPQEKIGLATEWIPCYITIN